MTQIKLMDDWMKSSALNNQVTFLLVDLDTALTFMNIAETTGNEDCGNGTFRMLGTSTILFCN